MVTILQLKPQCLNLSQDHVDRANQAFLAWPDYRVNIKHIKASFLDHVINGMPLIHLLIFYLHGFLGDRSFLGLVSGLFLLLLCW